MTYTEQQIRDMKPGTGLDSMVERCIMKTKKVPKFYSTDMDAAMVVEATILSMDDETKVRYMQALWDVLNIPVGEEDHWVNILKMVHASAADRCRAALLALRGGASG
ncbi:hypothetical protein ABEX47_17305 [Paenibacillus ehimensis]|uniref:hypothetical protein n=1 Tax=Paenibacillus ehimensis TaxID=79264 RepID=UPI003D2D23FC